MPVRTQTIVKMLLVLFTWSLGSLHAQTLPAVESESMVEGPAEATSEERSVAGNKKPASVGTVKQLQKQDTAVFQQRLNYLNRRYESFFTYQQELERRRRARMAGAQEHKKMRRLLREGAEKRRRDFVLNRKQKPSQEAEEKAFEKKKLEESRRMELVRQKYIEHRDRVLAVQNEAKKLPENLEVGIDYKEPKKKKGPKPR